MRIKLMSFGYSFGAPIGANHYINVNSLKNPARKFGLDSKTSAEHIQYIKDQPEFEALVQVLFILASFLAGQEDRSVLAIGCSSGRHRSFTVVNELAERLSKAGVVVTVQHRDLEN